MSHRRNIAGLTLIELVVVVLILVILAGAMIPRVTNRMAESRDARRLADMKSIATAIDQYFTDKRHYPDADGNDKFGGYDVSNDGNFIPDLVKAGYLKEYPKDPINDEIYHYSYQTYTKGMNGCVSEGGYYFLGLTKFETEDAAAKNPGHFKCSNKDWSKTFAYVSGGGVAQSK